MGLEGLEFAGVGMVRWGNVFGIRMRWDGMGMENGV